jgi:hypothetical protein
MFRFPVEVRAWLDSLAEREKRTLTAQVLLIFEEWRAMKEKRSDASGNQPPAS